MDFEHASKLLYMHDTLGKWREVETLLGLSHKTKTKTIERWFRYEREPSKDMLNKIDKAYRMVKFEEEDSW